MIINENNVIHLKTQGLSYLLKINDYNIPEHLHFGEAVDTADAEGFLCKPGLGWGASCQISTFFTGSPAAALWA